MPADTRLQGSRILVVDDSVDCRNLIGCYLDLFGASVTKAEGGAEARHQLQTHTFDVVLMDLNLADGDGETIVAELRKRGIRVPIIALTGQPNVQAKCLQSGFNACLTKPISAQTLADAIQEFTGDAIDRQRLEESSERVRALVREFVTTLNTRIDEIKSACNRKDWKEVRRLSHRLHGASSSCGFSLLANKITGLENAVDDNPSLPDVMNLMESIQMVANRSAYEFRNTGVTE
jgi:CheY-like chemotaxis protein